MSAEVGLGKVKAKLQGMKDKIEKAEDREQEAKEKLHEVEEATNKDEEEADSFRRRIRLVKDERTRTLETLEEKTAKLEDKKQVSTEHGDACKELEGIDRESDERLTEMEEQVIAALQAAKESDEQLQEIKQKMKVTNAELDKAKERTSSLESRCSELEDSILQGTTMLREKEATDAEAAEKEQELTEKLEFLAEQLKEVVARAEEAERKVPPVEIALDELTDEYDSTQDKIKLIKKEFEEMEGMVGDLTDGEAIEPKKITDRYQPQPEEPEPEPAEPKAHSDEEKADEDED